MMKNIKFINRLYSLVLLLTLIMFNPAVADVIKKAEQKGKVEFNDSCSLCHGKNAKGNGVFSEMLTIPTADLTQLRKNNDGKFPYKELYSIIDGRNSIKPHGPRQMPIWGDRYQSITWFSINKKYSETLARGRVFELLLYLESIQEQP